MKTHLEPDDIQAIAGAVMEMIKPLIAGNGRHEEKDFILDVPGLADYLEVSKQWIYERTHLKEIPHLKIDGQLRFRKKAVDKWLDSFNVPAVTTQGRMLKAVK